jgi:hypothetical protein
MKQLACRERDCLFDQYGKAVESYQTIVSELNEAAPCGYRHFYAALLKTADAAAEYLHQCRGEYEDHCLQHNCNATPVTAT